MIRTLGAQETCDSLSLMTEMESKSMCWLRGRISPLVSGMRAVGKALFVAFAYFWSVNIPTVANFKLPAVVQF